MFGFLKSLYRQIPSALVHRKFARHPQVSIDKAVFFPRDMELDIDPTATVSMGHAFFNRRVTVRVRPGATLVLGDGANFNNGCIITCRQEIRIGKSVLFGPNVMIYDHDHDYRSDDFIGNYKTGPIIIEDRVWIGANVVILRGTHIKANTVVAAGTVVKGTVGPDTVVYQYRELVEKKIIRP